MESTSVKEWLIRWTFERGEMSPQHRLAAIDSYREYIAEMEKTTETGQTLSHQNICRCGSDVARIARSQHISIYIIEIQSSD